MEEHTCERVFDNKNVKSKWVANVMVEKFQDDSRVLMKDIIHEMRSKYSVGQMEGIQNKANCKGVGGRGCK